MNLHYIVTAMDVDVIKEYVSLGVGIGIIASVAKHSMGDSIVVRSLEGLVPDCYAWICFGKNVIYNVICVISLKHLHLT